MIVDSSIWIDYFGGRTTSANAALESVIGRGESAQVVPCIVQEVLQGADNLDRWRSLEHLMRRVPVRLVPDPVGTAQHAARLYAECRWHGVTIRSSFDCLIAATCIELGEALLHSDRDFDSIARIEPRLKAVRV